MSWQPRAAEDPEVVHRERMRRFRADLDRAEQMVRVLAEQIRLLQEAAGPPQHLRLVPPPEENG